MATTIKLTATETIVDGQSVNVDKLTLAMALKKFLFGKV